MTTRDKLEYQKRLRFLREARAKTASEQLKLAKAAEESDLTKRMVTLGDEENRVPARGETPKAYNEVPKTRETSRVKEPIEAGDKGDNVLDIDLSDLDYAKISEQKRFYVKRVGREERNEPYSGPEIEEMLKEATPPQEDADQSLSRMKKRKKAVRTKRLKRKSHAKLNESNLSALLKECGCQMQSPFDAPEDEPQGYMLKQSLEKIGSQATDLSNLANHDDDPEPWVEFKVTSAAEQIDAVHDYIKYGRKHRSDMSGHEDMHPHDEMMNEIKKKVSLKTILEQTADGPTEFDYAMGMGATGFASPDASVPAAPTAAPTVSAPTAASRGRRAPVTDAIQACNLIFNEQTPRSFAMHLKRLKRGIEQNNATIADYELRANNAYVTFVTNRYMPAILAANASLSSQIETVRNAIRQFNTPALPQQLSQITNRPAVISKITTLQNVLSSNANICDSLRNAPPEATPTSPTPPRPETSPEVSSENVQSVVNREKTFIYNMPNNVFAPIIVRALERVNSGEITPDAIRAYAANPNMLGPDVESAVVELRRHINSIENAATQPPISEENITYARNALQELYNWSQQNIVRTRRTAPAGSRGGGAGDWIAAALTVGEESPLRLRPYVQGLISTRIYTAMGNSLTEAIARLDSAARGETIAPEYSTSGPVLTPSFITPSDTARSAPIVASTPASTAASRLAGTARGLYGPPTS